MVVFQTYLYTFLLSVPSVSSSDSRHFTIIITNLLLTSKSRGEDFVSVSFVFFCIERAAKQVIV